MFNVLQHSENEIKTADKTLPLKEQIEKLLTAEKIVVFMKGNADFPQCGFSANTVGILKQLNAPFKTFNILQDPDIRQGLKEYSNWPTYPQVYVRGELIGGNDIVTEMFRKGDLHEMIKTL